MRVMKEQTSPGDRPGLDCRRGSDNPPSRDLPAVAVQRQRIKIPEIRKVLKALAVFRAACKLGNSGTPLNPSLNPSEPFVRPGL